MKINPAPPNKPLLLEPTYAMMIRAPLPEGTFSRARELPAFHFRVGDMFVFAHASSVYKASSSLCHRTVRDFFIFAGALHLISAITYDHPMYLSINAAAIITNQSMWANGGVGCACMKSLPACNVGGR